MVIAMHPKCMQHFFIIKLHFIRRCLQLIQLKQREMKYSSYTLCSIVCTTQLLRIFLLSCLTWKIYIYIKGSEFVFESRLHSKMDMKMKWHIEDPRVLRRLTKDDWKVDVQVVFQHHGGTAGRTRIAKAPLLLAKLSLSTISLNINQVIVQTLQYR